MPRPIVALTSDFGLADGYVASMKGVILGIAPDTNIIDVAHDLPAHDVPHAAFVLGTTFSYFPSHTVHLAVVDPGVGTDRRPLLLTTPAGSFVGPDNGLSTYVLRSFGARAEQDVGFLQPVSVGVPPDCKAFILDREEHWLSPLSSTFHGRDIFAPAAGRIASGAAPESLGSPTGTVECLNVPEPAKNGGVVHGRIVYVDRFGNLVSNIDGRAMAERVSAVEIEDVRIDGLSQSYQEADGLLAIVGSNDFLEVALKEGSAAEMLDAGVGTPVRVQTAR